MCSASVGADNNCQFGSFTSGSVSAPAVDVMLVRLVSEINNLVSTMSSIASQMGSVVELVRGVRMPAPTLDPAWYSTAPSQFSGWSGESQFQLCMDGSVPTSGVVGDALSYLNM